LIDKILRNRGVTHFLFWFILVGTTTSIAILNTGEIRQHLFNNLSLLPLQLMAAYTLAYYQIPKLLLRKRYLSFFLSVIFFSFLFMVLARLSIIYIAEPFFRKDFQQESLLQIIMEPGYLLGVYFPAVYLFPMIFYTVKTVKERFEEKHQLEVLKKEKATTELNFLKAQIHPHFLFNTLNNLYSLTLDKSDQAPEVVVKLSEMLDYMLYQCSDPKVPIHKEITLLQNYIDLEALRYGDILDFVFDKKIKEPDTEIAPLILLSIVENAFKHGASGNLENPKIHINLKVEDQHIYFEVFNTKSMIQSPDKLNPRKGMGSANVKRQLDLIYPQQHNLIIEETAETYRLILNIEV